MSVATTDIERDRRLARVWLREVEDDLIEHPADRDLLLEEALLAALVADLEEVSAERRQAAV